MPFTKDSSELPSSDGSILTSDGLSSISSTSSGDPDSACIIGMACRVPGASTPSKLWDNIIDKVDLQQKMPSDRFNVDNFFHPDGTHKGTTNAKFGYFLDQDISLFDAGFFRISGREAEAMDPQQRLLLEVVYEALENAGITLEEIRGTQTSVFCGTFTNDYMSASTKDSVYYPKYTVTGTGNAILSNRISYFYDLHGPSATIDTACSSSLVCLHLGNQTLMTGEADIAIVVGSALHYDPRIYIEMTDLGMLSTDGRCRHGDAKGSGYVRGEGITAVVLKRKSRAISEGNRIRALIRGTGVNHDGSKQGITLPSDLAQADLIRRVYRMAGLDPLDTQYVECHGTGTKAGDPRELRALGSVFAAGRQSPLWVGSVKSNIGHLEGASGLAGIIKATLALEKQMIPPNMHFEQPNPEIDFEGWRLRIPTETINWKSESSRRASVNSFGYGGTNAHVILEEYHEDKSTASALEIPSIFMRMVQHRPFLVPLTSHTERAGKNLIRKFIKYANRLKGFEISRFASTLSQKRTMHGTRSFAVASSAGTLKEQLENPPPVAKWTPKMEASPRVGFVFTGQGAQWFAMGRQLIEMSPFFLQTLEKCDRILASLGDGPKWSIVAELMKDKENTRIGETSFSQPICTALQLAIVDLIGQWNIHPKAVVGHSSGEIAAAYSAGILSFENAMVAAYYRGLHMGSAAELSNRVKGAMMAIGLSESETEAELQAYQGKLAVAAMNSPVSFTVSGDEDAITELYEKLLSRKIFARKLQVAQAFHSHHMHPLAPAYENALSKHPGFEPEEPFALMVSSVTARIAEASSMGPAYFTANMTGTVRFSDALTGIVLDQEDRPNIDLLVEVGPHPALKGPTKQTLDSLKLSIPYITTLDRNQPAMESLLAMAGQLFAYGYPVELQAVNQDMFYNNEGLINYPASPAPLLGIPTYGWDHEKYWSETRIIRENRLRGSNHEILGAPIPSSLPQRPRYRNHLRISEMPWLADHSIGGKTIFPGAGYINMAIEAVALLNTDALPIKQFNLKDVCIKSALVVSNKELGSEIILELQGVVESAKSSSADWFEFAIFSFDDSQQPHEHCTGRITIEYGHAVGLSKGIPSSDQVKDDLYSYRTMSAEKYYAKLDKIGLQYGPTFQLLEDNLECGPGFANSPIRWRPSLFSRMPNDISIVHPALLDAAFHPIFAAIETRMGKPLSEPFVPTFIRSLKISALLNEHKFRDEGFRGITSTRANVQGSRVAITSVRLETSDSLLIDITGLEMTSLGSDAHEGNSRRTLFFGEKWKPALSLLDQSQSNLEPQSLSSLIDIFAHSFPNAKILHLTKSLRYTLDLLSTLGGRNTARRRFCALTIHVSSKNETEELQQLVAEYPGLVMSNEAEGAKYDLIVITDDVAPDHPLPLTENGVIITAGNNERQFANMRRLYHTSTYHLLGPTLKPITLDGGITLIMPDIISSHVSSIAHKIEQGSSTPVYQRRLSELTNTADLDGNVIVLASLSSKLFFSCTNMNRGEFEMAKLIRKTRYGNVIWLTRGAMMDAPHPEQAIIVGLSRSLKSENDSLRLVLFDTSGQAQATQLAAQALLLLSNPCLQEDEVCERAGVLYTSRCEPNDALNSMIPNGVNSEPRLGSLYQADRPLTLRVSRPGLLDSITFTDDLDIMHNPLSSDEIEIDVRASAINFRDVAAGMGIIADHRFGDECAGIIRRTGSAVPTSDFKAGDRVVAWRPGQGAHKTICRNPANLCYKIADHMDFATAAAMPLILTTAYFSLIDTARLQPTDTVLIHAAAGGVGQMAIQVAQMVGATIIATVGSPAKRELLRSRYGLLDDQIFSSRDDSFVNNVMQFTKGKGVDVALNSLAGNLLHSTWQTMAHFGRFIEIGKRDIHQNTKIDMDPFRRNVTFASVDLVTMFEHKKSLGANILRDCCRLVQNGTIKPPPEIIQLPYAEAEKGFRLLQQGKVAGKIILTPTKGENVMIQPSCFTNRTLFDVGKTYLLVGGLGGIGRSLSEWLYRRGARKLAFLSRSGDRTPDAKDTVRWLRAHGVAVRIFKSDVIELSQVEECIGQIGDQLAGIFQAAMILQDAPFDTMTFQQWQLVMLPKVRGTYNLHMATLKHNLDFFVCFSSVSAVVGSKGQANYAAANSYIDALCRHRRSLGLVASTMNVGMITGIGAVAENAALRLIMERIGYDGVNEEELFAQIENAITCDQLASNVPGKFEAHKTITGVNMSKDDFYWVSKPYFRNIYRNHDFISPTSAVNLKGNVTDRLRKASTEESKEEILTDAFIDKVAAILSVERDSIQPTRGLADYGLDSIVAVEIRKWFFKTVQVELAVFDVLGSKSIRALIQKAMSMLVLDDPNHLNEALMDKTDQSKVENSKQVVKPNTPLEHHVIPRYRIENIPMSTFQKRLWFAHNMADDSSFLNLPVVKHVAGSPDVSILRKAISEVKKRNEILRTAYFEGDEFAQQEVIDDWSVHLPVHDISGTEDPTMDLSKQTEAMRSQPLSIDDGEVFRVALFKVGDKKYALVGIYHHIAVDRGCTQSVLEQIVTLYDAFKSSANLNDVPTPTVRYTDFAIWHSEHLRSAKMQEHINFWKQLYHDPVKPSKVLPFAKASRPAENDFQRQIHRETLRPSMLTRMKRVSARLGATPAQFLLTALRAFLYRYTEEEDITIHMIDGNRPHPDVNDIVGFFVNVIPIRMSTENNVTFERMLHQVRERVLTALEHSSVPFDAIVDQVGTDRNAAFFPLGQVVFNYQMHGTIPVYRTQDFEITSVDAEDIPSACELNIEIIEHPTEGLKFRLESSSTLYEPYHMERFLDNFVEFLTSVIKDHRQMIDEISICGTKELDHLKSTLYNMAAKPSMWEQQPIFSKLLEVSTQYAEDIAIETSDGNTICYEQLVHDALKIAGVIQRSGAQPGDNVAIYSRPGIPAIASMIGAVASRCAYVALDPDFANDRLAFMVSDSASKIIMTTHDLQSQALEIARLAHNHAKVRSIESAIAFNLPGLFTGCEDDDPLYLIYTSGSTGKPKGVVLSHGNTHNMLSTLCKDYRFAPSDRFFHQSSICFDLSVVQIFSALTCGGRVCVASATIRKDPQALAHYMRQCKVSVTYFTPTQFGLLLEHCRQELVECHAYRVAFFAGERLPVRVAKAFYDLGTAATVYNTWSPSELVVQTTIEKVAYPKKGQVSIPIGFPMDNTRHYILDAKCQPLPEGFIGELVVGGAQVGLGYLNRHDANKASFVSDRFSTTSDQLRGWNRMFRTGDKGRFLSDGRLEFHGRIAGDKQIKLRGYRIDLGEVEQRLFIEINHGSASGTIKDIAIIARPIDPATDVEQHEEQQQIVAFVIPKARLAADTRTELARKMHSLGSKHLNHYMLPNGYHFLEQMPTTIGGKVDRQKLLNMELALTFPVHTSRIAATEATEVEASGNSHLPKVIELFREVLKVPSTIPINPDSNFFELGGQSILMLRLQAKIKRAMKINITLNAMFKAATPLGIAVLLQAQATKKTPTTVRKDSEEIVTWDEEIRLKNSPGGGLFHDAKKIPRSDYRNILLTGVDSFLGIHALASLLVNSANVTVHVLGSQKIVTLDELGNLCKHYQLFESAFNVDSLGSRVVCVPGSLEGARFDLPDDQFVQLGQKIDSIWHLGGSISLLKSYYDLKKINVDPVHDIVALARLGKNNTEMNYLSTWSVPHLQTWSRSRRKTNSNSTITAEVVADHFQPESSSRYGYFKSRWVAEMLFLDAAKQGFDVNIIRASAVTAHSKTDVTEPTDDFIRRMVLSMMEIGAVFDNDLLSSADAPFVVDFMPVDYLMKAMHALLMRDRLQQGETSPVDASSSSTRIFHVGNPRAIPYTELPDCSRMSMPGGKVRKVSLEDWLALAADTDSSPGAKLRWAVLRDYIAMGHNMFALDRSLTKLALEAAGVTDDDCPPIDETFLRNMIRHDEQTM